MHHRSGTTLQRWCSYGGNISPVVGMVDFVGCVDRWVFARSAVRRASLRTLAVSLSTSECSVLCVDPHLTSLLPFRSPRFPQLDQLPQLVIGVQSLDPAVQLETTTAFRKILSIGMIRRLTRRLPSVRSRPQVRFPARLLCVLVCLLSGTC